MNDFREKKFRWLVLEWVTLLEVISGLKSRIWGQQTKIRKQLMASTRKGDPSGSHFQCQNPDLESANQDKKFRGQLSPTSFKKGVSK